MPQKIIDYSFITFHRSLTDAYGSLNDPQRAEIYNRKFVQLGIMDETRQHTNADFDLAFGQDYKAELVDCCDNILLDITPNFSYNSFNHTQTGLYNMFWQLKNVGQSFYKPAHIKITHWSGSAPLSDLVAYSTPFHVQADTMDTTLFDYWSYKLYDGIDYATTTGRNRIRLKGIYTKPTRATDQQTYTQVGRTGNGQGNVIHNTPTRVLNYNWIVEYLDNHGMEAFESMANSAVIYVSKPNETQGTRATTILPSTEDVLGSSNFYKATWVMNLDRGEVYDASVGGIGTVFQLVQTTLQPFGSVTLATLSTLPLRGFFNKNITIGTGRLQIVNKASGIAILTYTQADITPIGLNGFEIADFAGAITNAGDYFITFPVGLFRSLIGEDYSVSIYSEWPFKSYNNADWNADDWNNNDWFTG